MRAGVVQLRSGSLMPLTGLGTWQLHEPNLTPAIHEAIKTGYRHIDGAAIYGNEAEAGAALSTLFSQQLVTRNDLFVTSKLWVTKMRPELVQEACAKSLHDWRLSAFDLYLIHWPFCFRANDAGSTLYDEQGVAVVDDSVTIEDTWRAMEQLVERGLAKNIGVSNFSIPLLRRILAMPGLKIRPAVNQVELHPYLPQTEMREFCVAEGIVCEAYSSLGSGKEPSLLEDETIVQVAQEESVTPSTVLLSWARQLGIPVLPKSATPARIRDNLVHHPLSPESMSKIAAIPTQHRFVDPMNFWKHPLPQ